MPDDHQTSLEHTLQLLTALWVFRFVLPSCTMRGRRNGGADAEIGFVWFVKKDTAPVLLANLFLLCLAA